MRPGRSRKLRSLGIGAAIAVGASLGVLAPTALAAPPVNNNFSEATQLGSELPVKLTESNAEATRQAGEQISEFAKGHSIWWEWEAPTSGWTTVSSCGSDFQTVLNVFEGTELEHLVSLVDKRSNGDQGPQCWASERTYTFDATAGHHYVIGADGNGFYPPPLPGYEAQIPSGEGTIELTIEATPPAPNDAFADAIPLGDNLQSVNQSPFEEPNEDEYFWEETRGYNWGATKEAGEPDHAGDPGGASVWYAWTPTRSGEAWISPQGSGGPRLLALYEGSSLSALTPVGVPSPNRLPGSLQAQVIAGHQYRIAVDGSQTEHPLETWRGSYMGSFEVGIQLKAPPLAQCDSCGLASPPPPTSQPSPPAIFPAVTLGSHQVDAGAGQATFRFSSPTPGASFVCKLDGKAYRACASPFKVKGLKPGKHVFRVLAALNGMTSTSPGVVHFAVRAPQRRPHRAG